MSPIEAWGHLESSRCPLDSNTSALDNDLQLQNKRMLYVRYFTSIAPQSMASGQSHERTHTCPNRYHSFIMYVFIGLLEFSYEFYRKAHKLWK